MLLGAFISILATNSVAGNLSIVRVQNPVPNEYLVVLDETVTSPRSHKRPRYFQTSTAAAFELRIVK